MMNPLITPALAILGTLVAVLAGVCVLFWGSRLPRRGDWLVGTSLLLILICLGVAGNGLVTDGIRAQLWQKGWIWPNDAEGAITVGVILDSLGLCMATLAILVSTVPLFQRRLADEQQWRERLNSAIAFSAAGVCLSWISLTPWLAFMGIALTVLGGFISLSANWESEEESAFAIRFAWERTAGLLVAIVGACGLAHSRSALMLAGPHGEAVPWSPALSPSDSVASALLVLGLVLQLRPFPFLGWVVSRSRAPSWPKLLLGQIFPAWAAFALLLRLEPNLSSLRVFPALGWFLLGSTLLATIMAFLQVEWRSGFAAWVSSGLTLAAAALELSGPSSSLALLLGVSLGATVMAIAARARTPGAKVAAFAGTCAATGVIGFVSAGGVLHWLSKAWEEPALVAAPAVVFFLFVAMAWKLLWALLRAEVTAGATWTASVAPGFLALVSLGVVWTGSISGEALPGEVDRVLPSLLASMIGAVRPAAVAEEAVLIPVTAVLCATVLLGAAVGYWASLKTPSKEYHGIARFIAGGYGVDSLGARIVAANVWLAEHTQRLMDHGFWRRWVPAALGAFVTRVGFLVSTADRVALGFTRRALGRCVDAPAGLLQLIQSGDVQWYIFFGIGSGIAILVHFLKF